MHITDQQHYEIDRVVNRAVDDTIEFAGIVSESTRDALVLVASVISDRLRDPDRTVEAVVAANYSVGPDKVRGWIRP